MGPNSNCNVQVGYFAFEGAPTVVEGGPTVVCKFLAFSWAQINCNV